MFFMIPLHFPLDIAARPWYVVSLIRRDLMPRKRANGEGSIRRRSDGRWEGRYTARYDPETGKRITKNVLGKTQAEIEEKLKKAIENIQDLDVARADDYTVAAWLKMECYHVSRVVKNPKR